MLDADEVQQLRVSLYYRRFIDRQSNATKLVKMCLKLCHLIVRNTQRLT